MLAPPRNFSPNGMTHLQRTARLAFATALSSLLLSACGGGDGGGGATPAPDADTQTLPTARAIFDFARATNFLSGDVQNLIVGAPDLVARGTRTEACTQGGSLMTTVVRNAADPLSPLVRQTFTDCRISVLLIRGTAEITYTRSVTEAPDRPWAGSVRFIGYSIEAVGAQPRQRAYEGLATGEGRLGNSFDIPERRMLLTDFTLRDNPDTLGRGGLVSTTARFELQRSPGGIGDPYTLEGRWQQQSGPLRVDITLDAGSQVSMVENVAAETARGSIAWTDTTLPSFSGRFVLRPSGRTAVRLELDLGADGSVDRDVVLDRYTQIGVGI
jgi:hypothetical protein